MANLNNLKNEYIKYKDNIELAFASNDYKSAKQNIEVAVSLLKEIWKKDSNPNNKKMYESIMRKLQDKYTLCKNNLNEPILMDNTNTQKKKSINKSNNATTKNKADSNKSNNTALDDDLNYEFNGINVKDFLSIEANDEVSFNDVVGMNEEKELIKNEFFISDEDKKFNESIGKMNKNFILLYGLPGTGKTYFAKAISYELGKYFGNKIPFFNVVCPNIKGRYHGETENRITAIFEFVKQFDRCVVFMDEFEDIGMSRLKENISEVGAGSVRAILQMLDGFNSNKGLLLIAATNTPYDLDGAILSRCNEKIEVPLPTLELIKQNLVNKLNKFIDNSVNLDDLANKLVGYSNRDIKNLINKILDLYSNEHKKEENRNKDTNEFKINNQMIEKALSKTKSSIKKDEVYKLEEYKKSLE